MRRAALQRIALLFEQRSAAQRASSYARRARTGGGRSAPIERTQASVRARAWERAHASVCVRACARARARAYALGCRTAGLRKTAAQRSGGVSHTAWYVRAWPPLPLTAVVARGALPCRKLATLQCYAARTHLDERQHGAADVPSAALRRADRYLEDLRATAQRAAAQQRATMCHVVMPGEGGAGLLVVVTPA
jgi:hypothetical protein